MLCDHRYKGIPLPPNLVLIAACNPYRKSERKNASIGVGLTPLTAVNAMMNPDDLPFLEYPFLACIYENITLVLFDCIYISCVSSPRNDAAICMGFWIT
jgi:hypothetical protein